MMRSFLRPSPGSDAVSLLTIYVCLLLAVPAPMVVGPLGSAGSPATILAITAFCLWLWFHVQRGHVVSTGHQPVRAAMVAWLIVMLVVYAHAMSQPIPSDEISPADSGMLRLIAMAGIVLVANDGVTTLARHRALARRLVIAVGVVALFGVVQYATKQLWIDRISIPGLTSGAADWTLGTRSGLIRPSGTATHPIEFGMVLTTVLPLAIAFSRSSPTRRWLYWACLFVISVCVLLVISRSAMICAGVGLSVMALSWSLKAKLKAVLAVGAVAVGVFLTVPGMLGTITNLFTGIANDPSVESRTGSYDIAAVFISRSPIIGRGFGTFLPKYWILDNGYLGLLIEGGIVGLAGLILLIVVAAVAAHRASRVATGALDREIARALVASIAAGAAGLGFFDTFAFPQSAGVFFLLIGMAGAAWRLQRASAPSSQESAEAAPREQRVGTPS